jgi:multiple sugar transport system substrate-binding protein
MKSLRVATLAVFCVLVLSLAACGGGGDGGDEGAAPEGKTLGAADIENAKGNVTWCIGKDTSGAFKQMIDLHAQQNPDVKVELLELPEAADEQRTQQIQRLRAKSPECDVLGMDTIWTAEYASQSWIYDLTDYVQDNQDRFIQSTLQSTQYQDKYWAVPFNSNAGFLYYRTDQVQQAPQTWQDAYQEAKAKDGLIYQGSSYEGLTVNFLELLYSAGGTVLSDDGETVEIDSPETRDVLEFMRQGIQDGAVPRAVTTYKEQESLRAFDAGRATFMRQWPYGYALSQEAPAVKGKFAVTPLPKWQGGEPAGVLGGYNLGIAASSDAPEAALEFIDFVTQAEPQKIMASKAALPAVLAETYDDPAVKKALPFATELREAIEQAGVRPVSPVYPQINEAIHTNVYSVLQGRATPDAAAKEMKSDIEQALKTF